MGGLTTKDGYRLGRCRVERAHLGRYWLAHGPAGTTRWSTRRAAEQDVARMVQDAERLFAEAVR